MMEVQKWVTPKVWDVSMKHNSLCEVCLTPIAYCRFLNVQCGLCNVVAHNACLSREQLLASFNNKWLCMFCKDDIEYSKRDFISKREMLQAKVCKCSILQL